MLPLLQVLPVLHSRLLCWSAGCFDRLQERVLSLSTDCRCRALLLLARAYTTVERRNERPSPRGSVSATKTKRCAVLVQDARGITSVEPSVFLLQVPWNTRGVRVSIRLVWQQRLLRLLLVSI